MPATIGQPAPDFNLPDVSNTRLSLADVKGDKTLVVFIPFPFTGICDGESCAIRDDMSALEGLGAKVVIISTTPRPSLKKWSDENGFTFPVLSDFWPHGATCIAYGCFNENTGSSMRATYVLDKDGIVRDIIATDSLGQAREHAAYQTSLATV